MIAHLSQVTVLADDVANVAAEVKSAICQRDIDALQLAKEKMGMATATLYRALHKLTLETEWVELAVG